MTEEKYRCMFCDKPFRKDSTIYVDYDQCWYCSKRCLAMCNIYRQYRTLKEALEND